MEKFVRFSALLAFAIALGVYGTPNASAQEKSIIGKNERQR